MKAGRRALGVAESYAPRDGNAETSTLCGVVVRADRIVDGFSFSRCTVGGLDATDAIVDLHDRLAREDVRYLLVAGVALSWYNVLDLHRLHAATSLPVIAVTFEDSPGLEQALRDAFDGEALEQRLGRYRELPERSATTIDGHDLYYRSVGLGEDEARKVLEAYTPEGGRPEPLRVARLAARGADDVF